MLSTVPKEFPLSLDQPSDAMVIYKLKLLVSLVITTSTFPLSNKA